MGYAKFLPIDELVTQMGGKCLTEGWDVVVSYRVDKLNDLLKKVWHSKETSDKVLKFDVVGYDKVKVGNNKFENRKQKIESWTVTLNNPTLHFATDKAVLQMTVSGRYRTQYYKGAPGNEIPDNDIESFDTDLSPGWVFQMKTGISAVTVNDKQEIQTLHPQGALVPIFVTNTAYVVFNCSMEDGELEFIWKGAGEPPDQEYPEKNHSEAVGWIKKNLDTIDFSLAGVTRAINLNLDASHRLTPESMVFKLYAPPESKDTSLGCLSLYIKTLEGGQEGNKNPKFLGTENILPIPKDHSASIIVSKKLIWDTWLRSSIWSIKNSKGTPAFDGWGNVRTNRNTGLAAMLKWNNRYPWEEARCNMRIDDWYDYGESTECIYSASAGEDIQQYLTDSKGAILMISDDGTMMFRSNLGSTRSRAVMYHFWVKSTGSVLYKAESKVTRKICYDDKKISLILQLGPKDWTAEVSDAKDIRGDMYKYHTEWLRALQWPKFSVEVDIDSFATTNVFGPGRHTIDLDKRIGVRIPYDFLFVGDMAVPTKT